MVFALITLYNPDNEVLDNIRIINKQVDKVFLLDNSSCDNSFFKISENIEYLYFNKNKGLSEAFNTVLNSYLFDDDDYILFFDQDSVISDTHINSLIEKYKVLSATGVNIGCLGPVYLNVNSKQKQIPSNAKKIDNNTYEVDNVITSSLLTTYKNIKNVNFWNENIFLDMADWDLCWRFLYKRLKVCLTEQVILSQKLGIGVKRIFGYELIIEKPIREYYQIRDGLKLLHMEYVPHQKRKMLFFNSYVKPILTILFLSEKTRRLTYIVKGFCDFLIKRNGGLK